MKKSLLVLLFVATPSFAFADATSTVTITIRDGAATAFSGTVEIAASTTAPVDIAPTNSSTTIAVPADSLLATLVALDATTSDFDITDLAYFSSYNSFIINCISIPAASTANCFNWTYAVDGTFPQAGVDHQILQNGDVVYLFFGPSRQTTLSTTTAAVGEPFTATAQTYDLQSGNYVGTPGLVLGVGISNPDFSFTELATSTSDAQGQALFTMNATGTFSAGIQEDFYFPSASITIVDAATSTPPVDNPPPTGGGISAPVHLQFNVPSALSYLAVKQSASGSFGSSLLDDWTAIAFAASDSGASKALLRDYFLSTTPALSSVTDYERHAMALMALGINPYSGTPADYIAPIINAFDGTQIGDSSLDNDDIFAIFPLMSAGYSPNDPMMKSIVAHILKAQRADGSWNGSPDMTAAAVQAIGPFFSVPGYGAAMGRAMGYLASTQQAGGGWSSVDSTSWVQTMMNAAKELDPAHAPTFTSSGGRYPMDEIAEAQQPDGAVRPSSDTADNRVWSTSYAVVAASGKSWLTVLQSFSRPSASSVTTSGGGVLENIATSTVAASSPQAATTTPPTATSTPEIISTSTPAVLGTSTTTPGIASSTASTTTAKPPVKKIAQPKKAPIPRTATTSVTTAPTTSSQAAAAVSAAKSGFLSGLWHSIASFFERLF